MPKQQYILNNKIKSLAAEDRPRERLISKGRKSSTDAELLAILLRTGTKEENAITLAQRILSEFNNNIKNLARSNINTLTKIKGVGNAKAVTILAGIELGLRCHENIDKHIKYVRNSEDINKLMYADIATNNYEEFWVIFLARNLKVIAKEKVSEGGLISTTVDIKKILKKSLENLASAIVLCHNHPSGNLKPSEPDIKLTKKIIQASKFFNIDVLDHVIFTETDFFSFSDNGLLIKIHQEL